MYLDATQHSLSIALPPTAAAARYVVGDHNGGLSDEISFDHTFTEPIDVVGGMRLRLWVEADGSDDMDLYVAIKKIGTDGQTVDFPFANVLEHGPVALGWLRVSHRELDPERSTINRPWHTHAREELLSPGQIVPVDVEIWPSSTHFEAGEGLRLSVRGSDFYTGAVMSRHILTRNSGSHLLHTGGTYDSHLVIPVLPVDPAALEWVTEELNTMTESRPPVILVLGASGNVGSALTKRLAGGPHGIRAFFDPSTGQSATFPDGVSEIHGTFDDASALRSAMEGVDAVFALTPPSEQQIGWQRAIAGAAQEAGVRRIVKLSAFETSKDSVLQMGRWHYDGERAVAETGCEYVILRPQYFMQMLLPALIAAARTGVFTGPAAPGTRLAPVEVNDIAAVAAVALTTADLNGQILIPTGPAALSFDEMAAELSAIVRRDIRYVQRSAADVHRDFTARGWPEWHISDYLKIHGEAASPLVTTCVAELTGVEPTSFAAFLAGHATELLTAASK